ncbi:recombination protein O N-terminal domain-containing protein [Patescibacteria group bacterium]|nr:recombination protein O N-terminal domain-containing protein [Patescibacteria group bacterium]
MAYHIYTTEGIILKRSSFGEANILLYILTKDLGLIIASAQSARLSVSKLRPALQEYSLVSISVVKGKNGWKITNVIEKKNYFFNSPGEINSLLAKVSQLLLKMIVGESPNPEIYNIVYSGFEYLSEITESENQSFEILIVLRILANLGYVVSDSSTEKFISDSMWDKPKLEEVMTMKNNFILLINKALKESHL